MNFYFRVEHVGQHVVKLIKEGKNGTIWVVENNEPPFAVKIPHYIENRVALD